MYVSKCLLALQFEVAFEISCFVFGVVFTQVTQTWFYPLGAILILTSSSLHLRSDKYILNDARSGI